MQRHRPLHTSTLAIRCALLLLLGACAEDSSPAASAGTGGLAGAAGMGGGGRSNPGAAGDAGSSGSGGSGGSGGATEPPLNVPRTETSDGPSVLDTPRASMSDGLCTGLAVYCNGRCLETEGATEGNCTLLKQGLGQTASLALTADTLYYTADNVEILRMDLANGSHTSIVRGLTFPVALRELDGSLYFAARAAAPFPPAYEARRVRPDGAELTVLSQPFVATEIQLVEPVSDGRLLLGVGNFELDLYLMPAAGGRAERLADVNAAWLVVDDDTIYFNEDGYLRAMSTNVPPSVTNLNQTFTNSRFVLHDGHLYHLYQNVYLRVPVTGGPMEQVQSVESADASAADTRLLGRTPAHVLLVRDDPANTDVVQLLLMPIAGGAVRELLTLERSEYRAHVADATQLYVAVGASRAGALLRIALE